MIADSSDFLVQEVKAEIGMVVGPVKDQVEDMKQQLRSATGLLSEIYLIANKHSLVYANMHKGIPSLCKM